MARSTAHVDLGLEQPEPYRRLYQGVALGAVADRTQAAFGQPMLDRTAQIVHHMVAADQADPVADPSRTAPPICRGLHGIVTLRIDKDTIPWPEAHQLGPQMLTALVRPR